MGPIVASQAVAMENAEGNLMVAVKVSCLNVFSMKMLLEGCTKSGALPPTRCFFKGGRTIDVNRRGGDKPRVLVPDVADD